MMPPVMAGNEPPPPFYRYVLLLWLLIAAIATALSADQLARASLGDPDNFLRLVQVRDWLNGQAWTDVIQHRMNPPLGGDMHWSRLVDMPIALTILALRPLVGQVTAEMAALVAVPALLFLALMLTMATLLRGLAGRGIALALLAALPFCVLINVQFKPMRLDHHGWQILMAAVALAAWMRPGWRAGATAGVALAFWMHVSIEGLPYALLFGGLFGLGYVRDGDRRIHAFLAALSAGSLLFLVGTHGVVSLIQSHCDAVSAPYLAALLIGTGAFFLTDGLLRPQAWLLRLAPCLFAGAGALAGVAFVDPACLAGPFASLEPIVRDYWYLNVKEGLPVWRQSEQVVPIMVLSPLPGMIAALGHAWTRRGQGDFTAILGLAIAASFAWLLGLLILRTGGVAQLYALPGMALLIGWLWPRRERFRPRIAWSVSIAAALLCATSLPAILASTIIFPGLKAREDSRRVSRNGVDETAGNAADTRQCVTSTTGPILRELGDRLLFAPLDVGPALLYHNELSVIASGYHRNHAAMAEVVRGFVSPPETARRIIMGTEAAYLLFCPETSEAGHHIKRAPQGLAAALARGEVPDWLAPDERLQRPGARLYRIIR